MSGLPLEASAPPPGLNPSAQARWTSVWTRVAEAAGGDDRVDRATLEAYCQVWARWREAENALAQTGQLVRKERGGVAPSPLVTVSSQAGVQVRALEQRLGLGERGARPAEPTRGVVSLRTYAKHRNVSPVAVSRAVKAGRLKASVVYDQHGDPKIADVAIADQEWEANTDHSRAPGFVKERGLDVQTSAPTPDGGASAAPAESGGAPPADGKDLSLSEASAEEKRWRAKLAQLSYEQKAGELVSAKDVADRLVNVFTVCRTKLLAIPSKAKAAIPSLTHADVATLDDLVRQALEELAVEQVASSPNSGAAA